MQLKHLLKRAIALALILALLLSLSACGDPDAVNDALSAMGFIPEIDPTEKLPNSAWINSDLEGSVTESSQLNLQDDFHATVNRNWFLEHEAQGNELINSFSEIEESLQENQTLLLHRGTEFDPDPNIMSKDTLDHLLDLVWDMIDLSSNQEKRSELGVEPLRPYLEAINEIDSLEEMTQYLQNNDKTNLTGEDFFNVFVDKPVNTRDFYTVYVTSPTHHILVENHDYCSSGYDSYYVFQLTKTALNHVLGQLGYTEAEVENLLLRCYTFERSISFMLPTHAEGNSERYLTRAHKSYTLEDIQKLQGNFPLTQLLEEKGVAGSETFRILEPGFLSYMGSFYKEKNLETLKAYFTVHTVLDSLLYLDETCREMGVEIHNIKDFDKVDQITSYSDVDTSDPETHETVKFASTMGHYIMPLISEPFQLAYIGAFCSSETKAQITAMVNGILDFYVDLLGNIEWLSQETRDLAVEKVQKTAVRIMYPDVLPDYSSLDYGSYEEGGNLLDAYAAIIQMKQAPDAQKVNQPVKRTDWDLDAMSTLDVNAYNEHTSNGIVILSGILAGDFMYDSDAPIEQNYGRLGTVLGHELTHSFDTTGYAYDSEGLPFGWWTNEDEVALRIRSDRLSNHYSQMYVFPEANGLPYDGDRVKGEAISDMGGVKCMLALAEEIPDFNYDLFFRSFASMWTMQTSYAKETDLVLDVHPLGFLRTNVTLQQFDKFFETYGIGPGDGMYLAPEDRILVW